jgi:hypothetical protein
VRQWPGNQADLDFRSVLKLCEGTVVVVPHNTLSCSATCNKFHSLLPYKKGDEVDKDKKKKKGGIKFTNSVKERDHGDGVPELEEEDKSKPDGPPMCASCGTLSVHFVCRECNYYMCNECDQVTTTPVDFLR